MSVKPFPVPAPQGGHLLGQPFTIANLAIPVNATIACNCLCASGGAPTVLQVLASAPVQCPSCQKVYVIALNVPPNSQLSVAMSDPSKEQVPS